MARGYNSVLLYGALCRKPELKGGRNGLPILEFTIAGDDQITDHNGLPRSLPWYHRSALFGQAAESVSQQFSGGEAVWLQGSLEYRSWENEQGEKRHAVGVKTLRLEPGEFGPGRSDPVVSDSAGGLRLKNAFNQTGLIGNLTRDPELRYTPAGDAVLTASIAVTENYKDRAGEWQETVGFFEINAWRELAELLGEAKKGQPLFASGRLINEGYTDLAGNKRSFTRLEAGRVELLERRANSDTAGRARFPSTAANASATPAAAGRPDAANQRPAQGATAVASEPSGDYDFPPEEDLPF